MERNTNTTAEQPSLAAWALALLLGAGTHAARADPHIGGPLHNAVNRGDRVAIRGLLKQGADVDAKNLFHRTALHIAAKKGYDYSARDLLAGGADIDARDPGGWTPLIIAAHEGHGNVVRSLLELGADPDTASNGSLSPNLTPRDVAAHEGHEDVVALLDAHRAARAENPGRKTLPEAARDACEA